MKKYILAVCIIFALNSAAFSYAGTLPAKAAPVEIKWMGMTEALAAAAKEKKFIVADFYTDWCGWCKKMDNTTYTDPAVIKLMNDHFIPVKLDAEGRRKVIYNKKEYRESEFAAYMNVRGFPSTLFFQENGDLYASVPGFIDASTFRNYLTFIGERWYLKYKSYQEYLKNPPVKEEKKPVKE